MSFEPIDWDAVEAAEDAGQRPVKDAEKRCTKRVVAVFTATFHGSYVPEDEIETRLNAWLGSGLDDRDDLRTWDLDGVTVTTVPGDPDGYDS